MEEKKQNLTENIMGTAEVNRLLITISLPMILSILVSSLYNLVDSMFVARLSEDALAAVSLAYPVQSLMTAVGAGTGVGINAVLSRSLGEKNLKKVDKAAGNGIFLCMMSMFIFCLAGIFLSDTYFSLQTKVPTVIDYGNSYLKICCIGSIGAFGEFAFNKLLQATGRTKYMMIEQAIAVSVKLVLEPLLIFGLGFFPALGIVGAALTTVIGQFVGALVGLIFNLLKNEDIHLSFQNLLPDNEVVREIYFIGIPSIIMFSVGSVMSFGINKILVSFTTTATAVFGVYFKLQSFVMMPIQGINNAMVPIVSYNLGAKKWERIEKVIRYSIRYAGGITLCGTAVIWLFTRGFLSLFSASETMLEIGIPALRICSFCFVFAGFNAIVASTCQAMGYSYKSLIISLIRQVVVLLPAAYLLSNIAGLNGIWWAFPIAEAAGCMVCIGILKKTVAGLPHGEERL